MTGIIDSGGGLRGIYGCGVLDRCLELGVKFDYAVGVSAGSANIASFLAGQKGRNYSFYHDYAFRSEYMGLQNLVRTGSFLGLDYIYGTLTNSDGENPLDNAAMQNSDTRFEIVATDAKTGKAVYFDKADMRPDDYAPLKASCSIPVACPPYVINGVPYFDGGLSDPIPVDRALSNGCKKIIVILTKPVSEKPKQRTVGVASAMLRGKYPMTAKSINTYKERYLSSLALARELEGQGRALVLAPDSTEGLRTVTRDRVALHILYRKGYHDAEKIADFFF